jgi:mercuric reductase
VNEGCIPTKALLRSAEVNHLVRERAHEFGVRGLDPEKLDFDLPLAMSRKDRVVQSIIDGLYRDLERNKSITLLRGRAEFHSPVDIRMDGKPITAAKTILAVGSKQANLEIPGLKAAGFLTNYEALELQNLPDSMVIIGAGYIGVEFAQMYSRFGTKVTLLSRSARVMPKEEPELSEALGRLVVGEGIDLHTHTTAVSAGKAKASRWVEAESPNGIQRFEAEVILVATGRIARVDGLGLDEAEVEMDGNFIRADDQLQTSSANIWSLGDANGGMMFTHRATHDGPTAALNAVKTIGKKVDYRVLPRAVFTEPALASVGLTEAEALMEGYEVKAGTAKFAHSGRAKAINQTEGMVKLISNSKTGELLGGHILGPHADELIHEVAVAMHDHGRFERLTKTIHIHPTLSEVVKDAAKQVR